MCRFFLLNYFLILVSTISIARNIPVKNIDELNKANKEAKPGDTIVLQNGVWENAIIKLDCSGTKELPIIFKAQTAGKVLISGNSKLNLGGNYIIVDGLYFEKGYAGNDAVIKFCINKDKIANNCRVTNTVINDFNNSKRLDENYWIAFYGKNNRLDHCSFLNKKNLGVLLAVILDDERSRENFHSIDHNYFGVRQPLASNGGEIIRVGVSQHCEFNSNTQITDNFFETCDGETEIVSIKSGSNIIRNNLFKECQGAVVFRHGNFNTVENNTFLGNNKEGTGGVRIINKGQWVVNNYFYQCRGVGFRSPLSIMNGVPNSPANRYVEVTDAVIANNSFVECTPISFCEGSDTERSVPPSKVYFENNIFFNSKDTQLCHIYDDISGIKFSGNLMSAIYNPNITGFTKNAFTLTKTTSLPFPNPVPGSSAKYIIGDSLKTISKERLGSPLSDKPGHASTKRLQETWMNAVSSCGAKWYNPKNKQVVKQRKKDCKTAKEIEQLLSENSSAELTINLTGTEYVFSSPLTIINDVSLTSTQKQIIRFSNSSNSGFFIQLKAGKNLKLTNLNLDLNSVSAGTFITTDTSGSSNHSNLYMNNCVIKNLNGAFFTAAKSAISDSIIINRCTFSNGNGVLFKFDNEIDNKGYYNVEKLKITNSSFKEHKDQLLTMLRGGNDESTMGPHLIFSNNSVSNSNTKTDLALIHLYGTQYSLLEKNSFSNSNIGKSLIVYEDAVRAAHSIRNNSLTNSGKIVTNKYVKEKNNIAGK
ncbi:MAG: DUF4957 domain-containing protein [Bacteroidetes bacterium]|nr:MAG: DUF4957 domain-containing protein [Bacteroidota bacterium]